MGCRTVFHASNVLGLILVLGCASASSFTPEGVELNRFRYVFIDYPSADQYGIVAQLSQLFLEEGFQPVSGYRLQMLTQDQVSQLLICNVGYQGSEIRAVVDIVCRDAQDQVVYSGSGAFGMGIDYGGDARGAALRAFQGFANEYSGFSDSSAQVADPEPAQENQYDWNTSPPRPDEVIRLEEGDLNPAAGDDLVTRISETVYAIQGTARVGTAVVISRRGLALTNAHVVAGEPSLVARSADGTEWPIRVLRSDSVADVALLEIACDPGCVTAPLASETPRVGADVLLFGNPLGLQFSLSRGIVSGLRLYGGITLVQTDASINPGNSGGPMVELGTGKVIALVSSKIVAEGVEGLGFGIAIADALRVVGVAK